MDYSGASLSVSRQGGAIEEYLTRWAQKTSYDILKSTFSIGNASSNGGFSNVMLVFGGANGVK